MARRRRRWSRPRASASPTPGPARPPSEPSTDGSSFPPIRSGRRPARTGTPDDGSDVRHLSFGPLEAYCDAQHNQTTRSGPRRPRWSADRRSDLGRGRCGLRRRRHRRRRRPRAGTGNRGHDDRTTERHHHGADRHNGRQRARSHTNALHARGCERHEQRTEHPRHLALPRRRRARPLRRGHRRVRGRTPGHRCRVHPLRARLHHRPRAARDARRGRPSRRVHGVELLDPPAARLGPVRPTIGVHRRRDSRRAARPPPDHRARPHRRPPGSRRMPDDDPTSAPRPADFDMFGATYRARHAAQSTGSL